VYWPPDAIVRDLAAMAEGSGLDRRGAVTFVGGLPLALFPAWVPAARRADGVELFGRVARGRIVTGQLVPAWETDTGTAVWSGLSDFIDRQLAHGDGIAGVPRLPGDPLQHLLGVELLTFDVLVGQDTFGLAGAADVHAHAGVPVSGEVGVVDRVPGRGEAPLAVGMYSRIAGAGSVSEQTGCQIRADRTVPSDTGIRTWSVSVIS
jgi:hypothetical protein